MHFWCISLQSRKRSDHNHKILLVRYEQNLSDFILVEVMMLTKILQGISHTNDKMVIDLWAHKSLNSRILHLLYIIKQTPKLFWFPLANPPSSQLFLNLPSRHWGSSPASWCLRDPVGICSCNSSVAFSLLTQDLYLWLNWAERKCFWGSNRYVLLGLKQLVG